MKKMKTGIGVMLALWGSEGAECDCESNCYTPRDSRNVNTHLMCQSRDAS